MGKSKHPLQVADWKYSRKKSTVKKSAKSTIEYEILPLNFDLAMYKKFSTRVIEAIYLKTNVS
jgi:hypothetical protein